MRTIRVASLWSLPAIFTLSLCALSGEPAKEPSGKIRVLVVTGGHDFEHDAFFKLFGDNAEISFQAVEHPNAHASLRPAAAKNYDVLVAYDMHQEITEEAKADLLTWLNQGK